MHKIFEGHKVLITGHSFGGALAALLTMKVLFSFKDSVRLDQCKESLQCITFGAPLFAGYNVYQHVRDRYQCEHLFKMFINKEDQVPVLLHDLERFDVNWIDTKIGDAVNELIGSAITSTSANNSEAKKNDVAR